MTQESLSYKWKQKPRIITYTNPKELKDNLELSVLMKNCVQLCASDTLLQGLIARYKRDSFGVLCSVEHFQEILFDYGLSGAKSMLQTYLDVKQCIDEIDVNIDSKSINCKNAFLQNLGDVTEAFRFLSMSNYLPIDDNEKLTDEQKIFFKYIYARLYEDYDYKYKEIIRKVNTNSIYIACCKAISIEVERFINEDTVEKIDTLEVASTKLDNAETSSIAQKKYKQALQDLICNFRSKKVETILIHGVIRFTPEIMMLIEALDRCGINIIFLINYCSNLEDIYGLWKRAYEWVGCEFENVKELNVAKGHASGRAIADISQGKRVYTRDCAKFKKYTSLTEFTDSEVRNSFSAAQKENPTHPLANMRVQYYSVDASTPNDVLRNYFPEQFIEKPFMSYPVGQFIRALFEMWDFDTASIKPNFNYLKECALAKIAHSRNDMTTILNKIELYFKDVDSLSLLVERSESLINKISKKENFIDSDYYLTFYDVSEEQVYAFKGFVQELDKIGKMIFGTDSMKQVDYQKKFRELIHEISIQISEKEIHHDKEKQLLQMLEDSLSMYNDDAVIGGVKSLKDAMFLYLQTKGKKSDAKWIVRGFDQLDGAPLMKNPKVNSYEITGLSMRNMSKTIQDILPWPLTEELFDDNNISSLYSKQAKRIIEDRNDYLKFYLFYIAFFCEKDLIFSYIENENDEKQRPYYLLAMLGLVPVDVLDSNNNNKWVINESISKDIPRNIVSKRERNMFSICPYKYFLYAVLSKHITYKTDYHVKYFLETEATRTVSENAKFNQENSGVIIETYMKTFSAANPYFDDAELSDIRKYIKNHFLKIKEGQDYIQKKRDFLIAQWTENDRKFMNFTKDEADVHRYLREPKIMPPTSELPHKKVCQECCFNGLCLNNYYDKEVDV